MERKLIENFVQIVVVVCMLALFVGAFIMIISGAQALSSYAGDSYANMIGAFEIVLAAMFLGIIGLFAWRIFAKDKDVKGAKITLIVLISTTVATLLAFIIASFVVTPTPSLPSIDFDPDDPFGNLDDSMSDITSSVSSATLGAPFQILAAVYLAFSIILLGAVLVNEFVLKLRYFDKVEFLGNDKLESKKDGQECFINKNDNQSSVINQEINYANEKIAIVASLPKRAWVILSFSILFAILAVLSAGGAFFFSVTSQESKPMYQYSYEYSTDANMQIEIHNDTNSEKTFNLVVKYIDTNFILQVENHTLVVRAHGYEVVSTLELINSIESVSYIDENGVSLVKLNRYGEVMDYFTKTVQAFVLAMSAFILISLWFAFWFSIHVSKAKAKLGNSTEEIISEK